MTDSPHLPLAFPPNRIAAIRRGFLLEWLSVAWMSIEAIVAVSAGMSVGSLTLTAFGLDSVIELLSAGVLIWRLTVELRRGRDFSERTEHQASRISGGLLFALAAYIMIGAAWSVVVRHGDAFSVPGLVVAIFAMPIMYFLARRKLEADLSRCGAAHPGNSRGGVRGRWTR